MPNREVNVTKRVKTPQGLRYCTVVLSANGRIKPNAVLVNGKQELHSEGAYYLEWRDGAKRVRLSVGKDAADASARRQRKDPAKPQILDEVQRARLLFASWLFCHTQQR